MPPHRRQRLCHAAQMVHDALAAESGAVALEMLDATADEMRARAQLGLYPPPEPWAEALGVPLWPEPHAPCGGVTVFGELIVRTSADVRRYSLAVLHELAHHTLVGIDHGHGDVWRLTLAFAVPRSDLGRAARDLRREAWVPGWAVDLRVATGRR